MKVVDKAARALAMAEKPGVEVVRSRSVRVNLGDYESVDFFVSMKIVIPPDANGPKAMADMRRQLDNVIMGDVRRLYEARGKKASMDQLTKRYGLRIISGESK